VAPLVAEAVAVVVGVPMATLPSAQPPGDQVASTVHQARSGGLHGQESMAALPASLRPRVETVPRSRAYSEAEAAQEEPEAGAPWE